MKALLLTFHAAEQLRRRNLDVAWIEAAVRSPAWREPDPVDPAIERRFLSIPENGGRVLRVACVETDQHIRVITAMFDRNAGRRP